MGKMTRREFAEHCWSNAGELLNAQLRRNIRKLAGMLLSELPKPIKYRKTKYCLECKAKFTTDVPNQRLCGLESCDKKRMSRKQREWRQRNGYWWFRGVAWYGVYTDDDKARVKKLIETHNDDMISATLLWEREHGNENVFKEKGRLKSQSISKTRRRALAKRVTL